MNSRGRLFYRLARRTGTTWLTALWVAESANIIMNDPFEPGLLSYLAQPPRKVALVRASRLGDFLCATPAFRALRSALPESEITLIALPFAQDLVTRSLHVNRFEAFPGFRGIAEKLFDARSAVDFLKRMQAERFDLAVQMHGSGVYSNAFTLLLGARTTAGFVREGDEPGCMDAVLEWPREKHEVRRLIALIAFLGAQSQGEELEFPLLSEDREQAEALLRYAEPPLIGINPTAMDAFKRWPAERFAAVGAELQRRQGGTVVVLGGPEERFLSEKVAHDVGEACLDLGGKTPLGVLGAVIERLSVLVTNDTGPAHISYALKTPTVTIFGGTSPDEWGPLDVSRHRVLAYNIPCRPCDLTGCGTQYECLEEVPVQQVVEAAEGIMRQYTVNLARSST